MADHITTDAAREAEHSRKLWEVIRSTMRVPPDVPPKLIWCTTPIYDDDHSLSLAAYCEKTKPAKFETLHMNEFYKADHDQEPSGDGYRKHMREWPEKRRARRPDVAHKILEAKTDG